MTKQDERLRYELHRAADDGLSFATGRVDQLPPDAGRGDLGHIEIAGTGARVQ